MTLEPEGIRQTKLRRRLRGYDSEATHAVLEQVASSYESILQERDELTRRVAETERELAELRRNEHLINETLLAATRRAGEVTEAAEREAELMLARAREEASRIEQDAADRHAHSAETARIAEVDRELAELHRKELLINEALLVATRSAAEVKEAAEREADLLLARARDNASRLEQEAADRHARTEETARQLERLAEVTRTRLATFLSQTLQKLQRELEAGVDGIEHASPQTEPEEEQAPLGTLRLEPSPAPGSIA